MAEKTFGSNEPCTDPNCFDCGGPGSRYTFDELVLADLHKEAFGFRPSSEYFTSWHVMTGDEKQAEWEHLCDVSDRALRESVEAEDHSYTVWQKRITDLTNMGATDKATAIRWDMQAQKAEPGEVSYYCYVLGLNWHTEKEIHAILNQGEEG